MGGSFHKSAGKIIVTGLPERGSHRDGPFRARITQLLFFATVLFVVMCQAVGADNELIPGKGRVARIIDGDTMVLDGGQTVRLLGIDTPEIGEPLFDEAARFLGVMVSKVEIDMETCTHPDVYGRQLSLVKAKGVDVNMALLREGLALPMLIPPCGTTVATQALQAAGQAAARGKGLYGGAAYPVTFHLGAEDLIGRQAMIRGVVTGLHRGSKAWHLNFGPDYRTDFTAVLFEEGRRRFKDLGVDPGQYVGAEVLVIGKLKRYNGPEIVLMGPDQILVISRNTMQ